MVQRTTQYIRRVPFNELRQHFPNISDLGLQIISGLTADLPSTTDMATNAQGSAAEAAQSAQQAQESAAASEAIVQAIQPQVSANTSNINTLQTQVTNLTSAVNAISTPSGAGSPQNAVSATRTQIYIQTSTPAAIWFNPTIGANTGWIQVV